MATRARMGEDIFWFLLVVFVIEGDILEKSVLLLYKLDSST